MSVKNIHSVTRTKYIELVYNLRTYLVQLKTNMEAGPISGNDVLTLHIKTVQATADLVSYASVPDIAAYVANIDQITQQEVVDSFNDLIAALTAIKNYFTDNSSTISANWYVFDNSGISIKQFSTAATAAVRLLIQDAIDQIEG